MEEKNTRRRILWLIVAVVIGAIVVFALIPSRLLVEVGRVATGPLQVTIDQEGETRAHDRFIMSAPVPGRLLRVDLEDGDKVKFQVRFKGRQMGHTEIGREKLNIVIEKLGELAKVEREAKMEGRQITMTVTRNK